MKGEGDWGSGVVTSNSIISRATNNLRSGVVASITASLLRILVLFHQDKSLFSSLNFRQLQSLDLPFALEVF